MITRVSGTRSRNPRIASTPSSFGITRSISTTAGRNRSASSTASAPSAASPTISIPSWSSRKLRSPSRRTAWSSAIRTRIGSDIEVDRRALALRGTNLETAADPLRPLLHRRQAEPARPDVRSRRVEADAVVDDLELEMSVVAAQPQDDAARLCVSKRVLHRLLRDPEDLGVPTRIGLEREIAFHLDLRGLHAAQDIDVLL